MTHQKRLLQAVTSLIFTTLISATTRGRRGSSSLPNGNLDQKACFMPMVDFFSTFLFTVTSVTSYQIRYRRIKKINVLSVLQVDSKRGLL